jgi:hypothetical protein
VPDLEIRCWATRHLEHPSLAARLLGPMMIMFLFIPILIFESAFNMDVPVLTRNLVPALTLAGPGLLISTALIGGLIHLLTPPAPGVGPDLRLPDLCHRPGGGYRPVQGGGCAKVPQHPDGGRQQPGRPAIPRAHRY